MVVLLTEGGNQYEARGQGGLEVEKLRLLAPVPLLMRWQGGTTAGAHTSPLFNPGISFYVFFCFPVSFFFFFFFGWSLA